MWFDWLFDFDGFDFFLADGNNGDDNCDEDNGSHVDNNDGDIDIHELAEIMRILGDYSSCSPW